MNNTTFCDLKEFSRTYEGIHGPLSFLVCVFGSVANILNICVLTKKEMRWPTNLILTGLAVADLLVMLEYIPFTFHTYINDRKYISSFTYEWAAFMIFHALFSQVFHFISCCLTVILAIWRYITITNPHNSRVWCSMKKTFYVVLSTYVICPIICCPIFISLKIVEYNQTCDPDGKIIDRKDLVNYTGVIEKQTIYYTTNKNNYKYVSFWVYGVVIKLVPCILLTHLSWRLISVLLETKKRRKLLLNPGLPMKDVNTEKPILNKKVDKDRQADRTSSMLVAVLLLFLLTEFPQAILGLLSAIIGEPFEIQCYIPLGKFVILTAL
ncbi:7TM GPCR Srw and/or 7tm 1 domain containing protein [Asbolus verrucosus]|uniref:7TM GPCR Srw and/or 7tm 1 domain containing protein n=1 Tax=Asbolus verrucosus TaxID=1661398 RepID=A0A482W991_ASBVE|nr:7TM GPCR Srw and/or 7tm 1 domain containing protein [Asbolus verrucosus]